MASTALLVMDVQQGIVDRFGGDEGYLPRLASAVQAARRAGSGVLRAAGTDHLVLTGIATSGVVISTLRQAADQDYRLTVLANGCLDADPEVHRVLTDKVYPRQADVLGIAEWAESLAKPAAG
jgi:nicotinamidase-related amidase